MRGDEVTLSRKIAAPRVGRRLLLLTCLAVILIPPSVAYAATQVTYASGVNGVGGTYSTSDYTYRQYNQVWHQSGKEWEVWYWDGTNAYCFVDNTSNPTKCNQAATTRSQANAHNFTDNSGVKWTAQTTVP